MNKLFWAFKMAGIWFLVTLGVIKVLEIILEGAIK
jgi:hypothetical protein